MQERHIFASRSLPMRKITGALLLVAAITLCCPSLGWSAIWCHYPGNPAGTPASGECKIAAGTDFTWPSDAQWQPLNSATYEPYTDTTAGDHANFVGNSSNPGIYWSKNSTYFFVRVRVYLGTAVNSNTFKTNGAIWVYFNTNNLLTYTPTYAVAFDLQNYPTQIDKHGSEMQYFKSMTPGNIWGDVTMEDVDGTSSNKQSVPVSPAGIALDIDGESNGIATFTRREGYIRTVDQVPCTHTTTDDDVCPTGHNYHTFIDFAINCSYLTGDTDLPSLCSSSQVRILAGSSNSGNDHNALGTSTANSDISGGLSLANGPDDTDWGGPTLIDLVSFDAQTRDGKALLTWETASEVDNAGFHLWRSEGQPEGYSQVTSSLIPAEGSAFLGANYSYTDDTVENGSTYFYQLEDIDRYGISKFHGPASVRITDADLSLFAPKDESLFPNRRPKIEWNAEGISRFKLQFSTDRNFKKNVVTLPLPSKRTARWINNTKYTPTNVEWSKVSSLKEKASSLSWRAYGKDGNGSLIFSEPFSLIIKKSK